MATAAAANPHPSPTSNPNPKLRSNPNPTPISSSSPSQLPLPLPSSLTPSLPPPPPPPRTSPSNFATPTADERLNGPPPNSDSHSVLDTLSPARSYESAHSFSKTSSPTTSLVPSPNTVKSIRTTYKHRQAALSTSSTKTNRPSIFNFAALARDKTSNAIATLSEPSLSRNRPSSTSLYLSAQSSPTSPLQRQTSHSPTADSRETVNLTSPSVTPPTTASPTREPTASSASSPARSLLETNPPSQPYTDTATDTPTPITFVPVTSQNKMHQTSSRLLRMTSDDRPYLDLVKGIDYIEKNLPYVDTSRAVALGASYGGFMVNWIQGHPLGRKFKALVTHDGVFSTLNQYASDELFFPHHDFGGTLWDARENYEKWDPAAHLKNWATPHFIIHNELDYRLPISEGLAPFNVLQSKGIASKFLTFPDENHWVLKPENSLVWHREVLGWINKYSGIVNQQTDLEKGVASIII